MTAPSKWTAAAWTDRDAVAYHAGVRPSRRACTELRTRETLNFAELDELISRCAGLLRATIGDPRGERVATLLRNSIDALALMYACERTGAIYTPLNWRLAAAELKVLAEDCGPRLLVVEPEFAEAAQEAFPPQVARLMAGPGGNAFREAVLASAPARAQPGPPEWPCIMLYTSGTTGRSKGVVLTRANLFWGAYNFAMVGEVSASSAMLCDAPMFHTVGLVANCRCVLQQGGAIHLSDAFRPAATLPSISDPALGITHYFGVPQIAQMLCEDPGWSGAGLGQLKGLFVGGAPLPLPLCERLLDAGVRISNGYGLTETSTVCHMPLSAEAVRARPSAAGLLAPAVEVRITDLDGREVAVGEAGEIWVRGPSVTPGYWRQPDATAAAFVDGWFRTGDAGRLDEAGYLTVVDRWKDMYISGGENVYPAEVENVIAALAGVREVGVVGVPNERWGEVGCAFIACDPAVALTEAEVLAHCRARLARYKQPAQILFVEALPRTASGKVRKEALRRQASPPLAG